MQGIEDSLIATSKVFGDLGWTMAAGTCQQDLTPTKGEGVTGPQTGLEHLLLRS
jgi:hypothetical protein